MWNHLKDRIGKAFIILMNYSSQFLIIKATLNGLMKRRHLMLSNRRRHSDVADDISID